MRRVLGAAIGTALGLLTLTAPASAQFLTFVSAAGNDANTCFVQAAPCKTLQRAINQTSPGGELRLLSSLVSNGFINKSITIEGGQNTVIGTLIVDSTSAIVRFRRLNLNGRNAFADGFDLRNAAAIHIEECSVERYTDDGIVLSAPVSTELVISGSVVRDSGDEGLNVLGGSSSQPKVTVENSRFENNGGSGVVLTASQASISRSVAFGNEVQGFDLLDEAGSTNIVDTIAAANNGIGFQVFLGQVTLESIVASRNSDGLMVDDSATARISNSVFSDNSGDGIDTDNPGAPITLTLGNNLVTGNAGSNVEGGLTPLAPE